MANISISEFTVAFTTPILEAIDVEPTVKNRARQRIGEPNAVRVFSAPFYSAARIF
jgi:hypothetical protein